MELTGKTRSFLSTLHEYSHGALKKEEDIGLLLELAEQGGKQSVMDRIAFLAKFITGTKKIMERIGRDGNGYDKLSREFTKALEAITELLGELTENAPEGVKDRFRESYLGLSPDHLSELFSLLSGITWYKNWMIDHHPRPG